MKKTKFLTLAALFTILTAIFCINAYAQETVIYIDSQTTLETSAQKGTAEAPFATMLQAQTEAKKLSDETVTYYLLSDLTLPVGGNNTTGVAGKLIKVTAESNAVKLKLPNGTWILGGDIEVTNLTLVRGLTGANDRYDIDLRTNNLKLGTGVKTSAVIGINQIWADDKYLDNQVLTFESTNNEWPTYYGILGTYSKGSAEGKQGITKGTTTVNVTGSMTFLTLGAAHITKGTSMLGTQNYIINGDSTVGNPSVRELLFGNGTILKGKRYAQINGGNIYDIYTTGGADSLTVSDLSGVNIIEINGGKVNQQTKNGTTSGNEVTEPANLNVINAYPGSEAANANVTRVVIFNNNSNPTVTVGDTGAIALRVSEGGYAKAVTTEPTAENNWACELLGFEIDIPDGYSTVLIDGEIATANDGLYSITEAGAHTVTFEKDYEITVSADNAEAGTVTGAGTYAYGTKATLKAEANFGFAFDGWYLGEEKVSADAVYEAEVKANADYVAKFVKAKIEIGGNVILANENGTPYNETYDDGTTYNNAAVLNVYDGEELVFTATEDENGTLEFAFSEELGTYRVVIVKNGYLTFDEEIEIAKGDELSGIKLIPGDIKGSYEDACGDGKVDIDDFVRVLRGFNADSADKLRHAVDINEDREVNVTDLGFIKATLNK